MGGRPGLHSCGQRPPAHSPAQGLGSGLAGVCPSFLPCGTQMPRRSGRLPECPEASTMRAHTHALHPAGGRGARTGKMRTCCFYQGRAYQSTRVVGPR